MHFQSAGGGNIIKNRRGRISRYRGTPAPRLPPWSAVLVEWGRNRVPQTLSPLAAARVKVEGGTSAKASFSLILFDVARLFQRALDAEALGALLFSKIGLFPAGSCARNYGWRRTPVCNASNSRSLKSFHSSFKGSSATIWTEIENLTLLRLFGRCSSQLDPNEDINHTAALAWFQDSKGPCFKVVPIDQKEYAGRSPIRSDGVGWQRGYGEPNPIRYCVLTPRPHPSPPSPPNFQNLLLPWLRISFSAAASGFNCPRGKSTACPRRDPLLSRTGPRGRASVWYVWNSGLRTSFFPAF